MREIEEIPDNGFRVVSTFTGCGGSCLGYRMAGYRVMWANEFIPAAQEVYKANHPNSILDTRDIRRIQPKEILQAIGLRQGEIDLLDGSPPCASFSTAGKREQGWGKVKEYSDTHQRVDDLFFEYARLLKGLQPKVFVAENVSGLVKGTAKGYFLAILKELKACGYKVTAKLLDAQWLGVPQMRQRLLFVGVRSDLQPEPAHPAPLPYCYGVQDACPYLSHFAITTGDENQKWVMRWRRAEYPFPTLTQSIGGKAHWVIERETGQIRRPTIPELKALSGFPEDFCLLGSYSQQWERLGRAVPPVMMSHLAKTIEEQILCRTR
jgi:DNA (cytosine-5)-methyltransferase 1